MEPLNASERRVLGVLIEKAMTQPDYYPMTVNAIVAGSNQKSNRLPIMDLDASDIQEALKSLQERHLVGHVLPAPGGRADRYKHQIEATLGWGPRDCAIMAELMLRGPQTAGELRSRCSRMAAFESLDIVMNVLDDLAHREQPLVATLPREPGRSAVRYTHLLYPEEEQPAAESPIDTADTAPPPAGRPTGAASPALAPNLDESVIQALESRITDLESDIHDLQSQVDQLTQKLDQLMG